MQYATVRAGLVTAVRSELLFRGIVLAMLAWILMAVLEGQDAAYEAASNAEDATNAVADITSNCVVR